MNLGLEGRTAIVAAASKGLGKAVALGLAREGARVAICARTQDALEAAAEEIRAETASEVLARPLDVTSYEQVRAFVAETAARFGTVDICVANAGGPPPRTFAETTPEDWRAAVDLNLLSTVWFAREVLPLMQRRRWGRFIAITSASVKQPIDGLILSNSVRSAVSGLVKTLSNEYGPYNVLVNSVCPGYTATARVEALSSRIAAAEGVSIAEVQRRWASRTALGRLGQPEEFASVVVFLASECASYVTGAALAIDGGLVRSTY